MLGAPSGPDAEDVQPGGPVPRICMDYFYVSSGGTDKRGAHGMSTKELQRRLKELGKSNEGQRNVLIRRYEKCVAQEDQEEMGEGEAVGPHASDNPMMVMVDESTGNKYMRAVAHKGVGIEGDNSWLVKDMHQELKSWGYPGGGQNPLILKSDGEPAIVAVREALARCHGGRITPKQPPEANTKPMALRRSRGDTFVTKRGS